jgi:hypothetical protein
MIRKAVMFFMVLVFGAFSIQGAIPAHERVALIAIYNATDGDNWWVNSGWKGNNNEPDGFSQIGSEGTWYGITVEGDTVTEIDLGWNGLSGSLPSEIGNLGNLERLDISHCDLSGNLPPELANLPGLTGGEIWLNDNRLTGTIPTELLEAEPEFINLKGNRLSGPLPLSFLDYGCYIWIYMKYNALYTNNPALQEFMDLHFPDWLDTQTVAPTGVMATTISASSIKIFWTPNTNAEDGGGYKVLYSTTSGDPYTEAGITSGKSVSEFVVTGLQPGTTYYFVVRTQTDPHEYNKNTVLSKYSNEVSAVTLAPNSFVIEPSELNFECFVGNTAIPDRAFSIS